MRAINQHHGQRHKQGPGRTVEEAAFSTRRGRTATIFTIPTVRKALAVPVTKLSCSGCCIATQSCDGCRAGCILSIIVSGEIHPTVCEGGGQEKRKRDKETAAQRKKGRMKGFCETCWGAGGGCLGKGPNEVGWYIYRVHRPRPDEKKTGSTSTVYDLSLLLTLFPTHTHGCVPRVRPTAHRKACMSMTNQMVDSKVLKGKNDGSQLTVFAWDVMWFLCHAP